MDKATEKLKAVRDKLFQDYLKADAEYRKAGLGNIADVYTGKFISWHDMDTYMRVDKMEKRNDYVIFIGQLLVIMDDEIFYNQESELNEFKIFDFDTETGLNDKLKIIDLDTYKNAYKHAYQKMINDI